ncbi:hypothetical protein SLEP1_g9995 [Rubroshorea leprosula]|uniref:Uncharacterized protein n=1 Tax=Rubroshorea leprosula TaxID=152421 RepID=A0AAV5I6P3_9ROSI|nr:hypothetical protein SLEP1_g9995 [Rubroshorea leprosula]
MTGTGATAHGSTANSGDLIAVGADGRGSRIKVMQSMNQPSLSCSWIRYLHIVNST